MTNLVELLIDAHELNCQHISHLEVEQLLENLGKFGLSGESNHLMKGEQDTVVDG